MCAPFQLIERSGTQRKAPLDKLSLSKRANRAQPSAMQAARPSSSLSAPKSATTLWTARLIATLWKLAVSRARKQRGQSRPTAKTSDVLYCKASQVMRPTPPEESDETSIMREAALSVVASGVVSLADLEALTGYRFSEKNGDGMPSSKDDDASSEAATEVSECCSIAGSDLSESTLDEEFTASSPARKSNVCKFLSRRRTATKWVRVGYGRYVKVQE